MAESAILSPRGKRALFAAPLVLIVLGVSGSAVVYSKLNHNTSANNAAPPDGPALFRQHCAYCHGPAGRGDGPAAVNPRARAFGLDKFRFATTPNANPCDHDLERIIKNGIPGSAMPKFDHLKDTEVHALIEHVRTLARPGVYHRWLVKALKTDPDDPPLDEVAKKIEAELEILPCQVMPALPKVQSLANGKKIYDTSCAQCHGPTGKGDGPQEQRTDDGTLIRPRDLTTGTYKGGGRTEDLYARITLGVPGTPMPATTTLKPQDLADLIGYIQSLASR